MEYNELTAISPIDGRYRNTVGELSEFFSEYAFMKYRIKVEIKWLIHLLEMNIINENASEEEIQRINNIYEYFDVEKCKRVKEIENITNHDVKAVEYYVREEIEKIGLKRLCCFVHFGCTSEDINNLAYNLMIKGAMNSIILPAMDTLVYQVKENAKKYASIPMLSHTHGQPATPVTVGKELSVFVYRWQNSLKYINSIVCDLQGKFSSTVGAFNAWQVSFPQIDWIEENKRFVEKLGLNFNLFATQIENHDTICTLFSMIKSFNNITQDFNSDMWLYTSLGYFKQKVISTETGSSVMPHKVNPINHESSMANTRMANSIFDSLTNNLQVSRMQRDLSDSSMLRNIGVAFSHTLLSIKQSQKGFAKMEVNEGILRKELNNNPEVLAEAVQTILRKNKYDNAYELLKEFTRGKDINIDNLREFINGLDINQNDKEMLLNLTPEMYIGLSSKLCDMI